MQSGNIEPTTCNKRHPFSSNHELVSAETIVCAELSMEAECRSNSLNNTLGETGKDYHDLGFPQHLQNTISFSWLDSLVFSNEADPFYAD
jgi:hypothetical protein